MSADRIGPPPQSGNIALPRLIRSLQDQLLRKRDDQIVRSSLPYATAADRNVTSTTRNCAGLAGPPKKEPAPVPEQWSPSLAETRLPPDLRDFEWTCFAQSSTFPSGR